MADMKLKAVDLGKVHRKVVCTAVSAMFRGWQVTFEDAETKQEYSFFMETEPQYTMTASYLLTVA